MFIDLDFSLHHILGSSGEEISKGFSPNRNVSLTNIAKEILAAYALLNFIENVNETTLWPKKFILF